MALFMKILRESQNRTVQQKSLRMQREATIKREDPVLYEVKMKLKNHPDPEYSRMSEEEMTREANRLINPEMLKDFFKELTHQPLDSIMEEVANEGEPVQSVRQKHLDRVGQLTLRLHLSHPEETPSYLTRLGVALLRIPYGVLHASLEIGDTSNPNISYIVEFNHSSLVQPRKKTKVEHSALEATIALGGPRIRTTKGRPLAAEDSSQQAGTWPRPHSRAEEKLREVLNRRTGIGVVDCYYGVLRPRSECITGETLRNRASSDITPLQNDEGQTSAPPSSSLPPSQTLVHHMATNQPKPPPRAEMLPQSLSEDTNLPTDHEDTACSNLQAMPSATSNQPNTELVTTGEDLTPFVQMSLSKILLVDKLVNIIIKYNKSYYYHNIARNSKTFVTEVLQSFKVWDTFKLGERLEVYMKNLNKGRKEVYKSHKAVNDRVRYLVSRGEIKETPYDEMRYLRSLYTIFHTEETRDPITAECKDPNCMLNTLEEHLEKKRPEGATRLLPPENYV